jgi:hypothetical protein
MQVEAKSPCAKEGRWCVDERVFTPQIVAAGGKVETPNKTGRRFAAVSAKRTINLKKMAAIVFRATMDDGAAKAKDCIRGRRLGGER